MAKKKGKSKKNKISPETDSDSSSGNEDNDLPPEPPEEYWDKAEEVYLQPDEISEQQVKDAMLEFVSQNCCYGKKPAEEMEIKDIKASSAYHYVLETFTEERDKEKRYVPYHGQYIDGKENGKKPKKWDVDIDPPHTFINKVEKMEVPHSAKVKGCKDCDKEGEFDCDDCERSGKRPCTQCSESGNVMRPDENGVEQEVQCDNCHGSGQATCETCDGDGRLTCEDCDGSGEVKKFQELTVTWKNHVDDYMSKSADIPEDIAESGTGTELFRQENKRIPPLTSFYDPTVNEQSQKMVNEHSHLSSKAKILRQRHHLRVIPISEVVCKWDDAKFSAVIYGLERKVYCPDYPQQWCCGCVIL